MGEGERLSLLAREPYEKFVTYLPHLILYLSTRAVIYYSFVCMHVYISADQIEQNIYNPTTKKNFFG